MPDETPQNSFNYALEVSYDGGCFAGWQSQPGGTGVQDALERAFFELGERDDRVTPGGPRRVNGAGRTDLGVHARAQIASVSLSKPWVPRRLILALNAKLPGSVSVMRAAAAPPGFHARRSAVSREYRYFIWNASVCYPHMKPCVLWQPGTGYDWGRAAAAAKAFIGTHDFRAFCRKADVPDETNRTVIRSSLGVRGNLIVFRVEANAFLTNMVRIMAGNLMEVARGRFDEGKIAKLLSGEADRTESAATPSPSGLFLWKVNYAEKIGWS
jgi:tRNA pseudouridine38-40 synthase